MQKRRNSNANALELRISCTNPSILRFPAIYICSIMGQLTASLIITACLLNLYHHRPDVPPPAWLQTLVHGCLQPLLCVRCHVRRRSNRKGDKRQAKYAPSDGQPYILPRVYTPIPQAVSLPEYVRNYLLKKIEDDKEAAILESNTEEWQVIARVLDRFFFIVFILFITILTAVIFKDIVQWRYIRVPWTRFIDPTLFSCTIGGI